jgi:hypothetical protein
MVRTLLEHTSTLEDAEEIPVKGTAEIRMGKRCQISLILATHGYGPIREGSFPTIIKQQPDRKATRHRRPAPFSHAQRPTTWPAFVKNDPPTDEYPARESTH